LPYPEPKSILAGKSANPFIRRFALPRAHRNRHEINLMCLFTSTCPMAFIAAPVFFL
jgi:hypothetical protein